MTRSWVFAARGQLLTSITYNAAGTGIFIWLIGSGLIGAIRLIARKPKALKIPDNILITLLVAWAGLLFFGLWIGRWFGLNNLP